MKSDLNQVRNTVHFTNVPIEKRNRLQKMIKKNSISLLGTISVLLIITSMSTTSVFAQDYSTLHSVPKLPPAKSEFFRFAPERFTS